MKTSLPAWFVALESARVAFYAKESVRDAQMAALLAAAQERQCVALPDGF